MLFDKTREAGSGTSRPYTADEDDDEDEPVRRRPWTLDLGLGTH
jgi:hypothetical protein